MATLPMDADRLGVSPPVLRTTTVRSGLLGLPAVGALDLVVKMVLVAFLVRLVVDPAWGNLEGKAPVGRAVIYPCLGLVVPSIHLLLGRGTAFPWKADLLVTIAGFSDILGNRLDLYDRIAWFDDAIHFTNTGLIVAAVLLLGGAGDAPFLQTLDRAVAVGLSVSLGWELWEYYAFVARSAESATAYPDTIGDLALGWAGAVVAAIVVAGSHHRVGRPDRARGR